MTTLEIENNPDKTQKKRKLGRPPGSKSTTKLSHLSAEERHERQLQANMRYYYKNRDKILAQRAHRDHVG